MDNETLENKIRELDYQSQKSRQRLSDMMFWLDQYQQKARQQAKQLTDSLTNTIKHIIKKNDKNNTNVIQPLWKNRKPTMRIGYNNFKPAYIPSQQNLPHKLFNHRLTISFCFTTVIHCSYNSHSVYESHLTTQQPSKFKLKFYIFGQILSSQYLVIKNEHIYKWKQYKYLNKVQKYRLQYQIDFGNSKILDVQHLFLQKKKIDVVCVDEMGFVIGIGQIDMIQLVQKSMREESFQMMINLKNDGRQYLNIVLLINSLFKESQIDDGNIKQNQIIKEQIELFYDRTILLPILVSNHTKYTKTSTLEFSCKYNSFTFVTNQSQFNRLNRDSSYKFDQPKFISENSIELQSGDQILVYLVLNIQKPTQYTNKQIEDKFTLHAMNIKYDVYVREYRLFEILQPTNMLNVPKNKYLSFNNITFYRQNQKIQLTKLSGTCGQYIKLGSQEIMSIYPSSIHVSYLNGSTYICCYCNITISYKSSSDTNKLIICNVEIKENRGINTVLCQKVKPPQQIDLSQCGLGEGKYRIISQNQRMLKVLNLKNGTQFEYEQNHRQKGFRLWVSVFEEFDIDCVLYLTNMDNLKTIPILIKIKEEAS